jgi:hypothetical protein
VRLQHRDDLFLSETRFPHPPLLLMRTLHSHGRSHGERVTQSRTGSRQIRTMKCRDQTARTPRGPLDEGWSERPHGAIGHKLPISLQNPGGASSPPP